MDADQHERNGEEFTILWREVEYKTGFVTQKADRGFASLTSCFAHINEWWNMRESWEDGAITSLEVVFPGGTIMSSIEDQVPRRTFSYRLYVADGPIYERFKYGDGSRQYIEEKYREDAMSKAVGWAERLGRNVYIVRCNEEIPVAVSLIIGKVGSHPSAQYDYFGPLWSETDPNPNNRPDQSDLIIDITFDGDGIDAPHVSDDNLWWGARKDWAMFYKKQADSLRSEMSVLTARISELERR